MVGSRDFFDEEHDGQVNAAVALRQPGSALKPFTFALAFDFIGVETLLRWLRETGFEELTQEPEFYGSPPKCVRARLMLTPTSHSTR